MSRIRASRRPRARESRSREAASCARYSGSEDRALLGRAAAEGGILVMIDTAFGKPVYAGAARRTLAWRPSRTRRTKDASFRWPRRSIDIAARWKRGRSSRLARSASACRPVCPSSSRPPLEPRPRPPWPRRIACKPGTCNEHGRRPSGPCETIAHYGGRRAPRTHRRAPLRGRPPASCPVFLKSRAGPRRACLAYRRYSLANALRAFAGAPGRPIAPVTPRRNSPAPRPARRRRRGRGRRRRRRGGRRRRRG